MLILLRPHSAIDVTTNSSSEMFPVKPGTVTDADLDGLIRALYPIWKASGEEKYEARQGWTADELARAFSFDYLTKESAEDYLENWADDDGEDRKSAAEAAFHKAMEMDDVLASTLLQKAAIREAMGVDAKEEAKALLVPGNPCIWCCDDETPISFFHLLHSVLGGYVFVNR